MLYKIAEEVPLPINTQVSLRSPQHGWPLGGIPHFPHLPTLAVQAVHSKQCPKPIWPDTALVKGPVFPKGEDPTSPANTYPLPPAVQSPSW